MKLKVYVTIQVQDQLTNVTRLPAEAFTLSGNIYNKNYIFQLDFVYICYNHILNYKNSLTSDIITHGIPDIPIALNILAP